MFTKYVHLSLWAALTMPSLVCSSAFAADINPFSDLTAFNYFVDQGGLKSVAQINQDGPDNFSEINQISDPSSALGNFAEIFQTGCSNEAHAKQDGQLNKVTINQTGTGNYAITDQAGTANSIVLTQSGDGNTFAGNQYGKNNSIEVIQPGLALSTITIFGDNNSVTLNQKPGGEYNINFTSSNMNYTVTQR